ncbi:MAG: Flp pilus assembly complex ATPase component TadA [Burkholderiaceae bacterium]|nr:Flp pilus assembly complex ATPase component TadA [Burkholderiaceae bacterium]
MSDMSQPPLSLVPFGLHGAAAADDQATEAMPLLPLTDEAPAAAALAFCWPAPRTQGYPAAAPLLEPEPCEIEGLNGAVNAGKLLSVDLAAGVVQLHRARAREPLVLRLTQFRRLTLMRPLSPLPAPAGTAFDDTTPLLPRRDEGSGCRLRFRDGGEAVVNTVGQVELDQGLFTFAPINLDGDLLRSFYPRPVLDSVTLLDRGAVAEATPATPAATAAPTASGLRSLGEILPTAQIATPAALLEAIAQQARMPMVRIGEALQALGYISAQQLSDALQEQKRDRSLPLGELLVRRGVVTRADLQTALARKMGYPIVDAGEFTAQPEAVLRVPVGIARRMPALPLMLQGGRLIVALEDPSARSMIDEIEFTAQCKVVPVLARAGTLAGAVERVYQRLGSDAIDPGGDLSSPFAPISLEQMDKADQLLATLEQGQGVDDEGPAIEQSDNSLVRLINTMIIEARSQGVSDIHIECPPSPAKVQVRFRRDGQLRRYIELPPSYRQAMVARIKVMCDLDISERRKPQDGKINFARFVPGHKLELRVATIPTANGLEDVVMRLLASAKTIPLQGMGLQPDTLAQLKGAIERPYGMVLCVGPTGSGKTTTLHAALHHLNTPDRKIWTAEDPVEITQPGLRQVQVNARIDWTFAKALRAFLRADPDVLMVGEIRDHETAQMAIEASLTGHLVLSTLHTNSAPETVTRLLDMGMDPFSFADSLLAVLAQRLVRRWCAHCVSSTPATVEDTEMLLDEYLGAWPEAGAAPSREALLADWLQRFGQDGRLMTHHAEGCPRCNGSGYSGRVGLHELLVVSRELRHLIQTRAPSARLQLQAMGDGMRTLRQDGILKLLAGLTSIEEVRATSNA